MTKEELLEWSSNLPMLEPLEPRYINAVIWNQIYEAFKERLKNECMLNIWPNRDGK